MLDEKKKDKIPSKFDLFKKYNKLKNKNSTGATLGNVVSTKEKRNTVRYSKGRNRKFIFYLIPFCSDFNFSLYINHMFAIIIFGYI